MIYKNNQLMGKMFQYIKDIKKTNWRFVVSAFRKGECIELLSCKGMPTGIKQSPSIINTSINNINSYSYSNSTSGSVSSTELEIGTPQVFEEPELEMQESLQIQQTPLAISGDKLILQEKEEEIKRLKRHQFS